MTKKRIIVIGAGPAGLMASGQAAMAGADTLLLEKKKRPGIKLRITGKGRCNITNTAKLDVFLARFGTTGEFLRPTFSQFFNGDLVEFIERCGLSLKTERGGRVFPVSDSAPEVLDALMKWNSQCGVKLKCSSQVDKLVLRDGRVAGVACGNRIYACEAVIVSTGGASYPATGSTGDGYRLAASVGHSVVPIRPALVPLIIKGDSAQRMDGVSLINTKVRLHIDKKMQSDAFGEVTFTSGGVGGPVVLKLSRQCVDAVDAGQKVELRFDLKPALSEKKLDERISRDMAKRGEEPFKSFMRGLLPKQVVSVCLIQTGISGKRIAKSVTDDERQRLIWWLKDFRLKVTGYLPLSEAIVTAGGLATEEIDPLTMKSRLVDGLYFAGEVIDVDADTGGYNLQAAFSTGWLAGCSAAANILKD